MLRDRVDATRSLRSGIVVQRWTCFSVGLVLRAVILPSTKPLGSLVVFPTNLRSIFSLVERS